MNASRSALLPIILITIGAVLGLAATDLVLPAIPILPDVVTGSAESAQWVLPVAIGAMLLSIISVLLLIVLPPHADSN